MTHMKKIKCGNCGKSYTIDTDNQVICVAIGATIGAVVGALVGQAVVGAKCGVDAAKSLFQCPRCGKFNGVGDN